MRPQRGGTQDTPDETLFAAIIYVLVSGCTWRGLPPCFGISKSTAHHRFLIWSRAGVWGRPNEAVLPRLDDTGLIDVSRVVLDSAHVGARNGGELKVRDPLFRVDVAAVDHRPGPVDLVCRVQLGKQDPMQIVEHPGVDPPPARHA